MLGRKRPLNPGAKVTGVVLEQPSHNSEDNGRHHGRMHIMSARALRYIIPALSVLAILLQGAVFVGRQDIPAEHAARNWSARQTTSGSRRRKLRDATTTSSSLKASSTAKTGTSAVEPETADDEFKELLELDSKLYNLNFDSLFPKSMNKLVTDIAILPRKQFARELDVGYALDKKQEGNEQVLLLYANQTSSSSSLQSFSVRDAKERCKAIKVVLTDPDPKKQECIAIMGQWSSYHVHKFKRKKIKKQKKKDAELLEDADGAEKGEETENDKYEFKYSPARRTILPTADQQEANRRILLLYLSSYPAALEKLKPIAELASRGGSNDGKKMPITVLLSNYGQSRFLINYICAARARNIDVSRVLLFATDKETYKLGKSMGLAVFYDELFAFFPKDAAKNYHDIGYALLMMAKVFSVHLVNALGHDLLFSDVDIALYKDPTEYFFQQSAAYDAFFQHDGYHHPARFAPLAANTGFYYVQNNERTRYFFSVFVRMGDLVIKERSHQAALTTLINEHMSLYGLRVKVMGKDSKQFMSGYHYHADKKLMRKLKEGRHEPHLFHANWLPGDLKMPVLMETKNWFVQEQCLDKSFSELKATAVDEIGLDCCLLEPAPYVKESSHGDEEKTEEEFQKVIERMQNSTGSRVEFL